MIESAIVGREIETAVLGLNSDSAVAKPGEVVPRADIGFYSYEGKYVLEDGAKLHVPARLTASEVNEVQLFARKIYQILGCDGMARVDLFLEKGTGRMVLNEVNTIPGFTNISMFPKLWEHEGISYPDLITKLIEHATDRHQKKSRVSTQYESDLS